MLGDLEALDSIDPVALHNEFDITINSESGREKPKLAQINIFTDGSKTNFGVGAGFVIMKGRSTLIHAESIALQREATIFQAEAAAIHHAILIFSYKIIRKNTDSLGYFLIHKQYSWQYVINLQQVQQFWIPKSSSII